MNTVNTVATQVSTLASHSVANVWVLAGNFLALVVFTALMLLFSYRGGKGGILSLILAFYAGYGIYLVFPYTNAVVAAGGTPILKAVISIVLYGIATYLPFHFIQRLTSGGFGVLAFIPRLILSFLSAAFLIALAYHLFHVSNIYSFPEPMNTLFAPNQYFFWWFIAPLVGLLFLVR